MLKTEIDSIEAKAKKTFLSESVRSTTHIENEMNDRKGLNWDDLEQETLYELRTVVRDIISSNFLDVSKETLKLVAYVRKLERVRDAAIVIRDEGPCLYGDLRKALKECAGGGDET